MTAGMGPSSVTESGEGEGAVRESDAALCSVFCAALHKSGAVEGSEHSDGSCEHWSWPRDV